MQKTQILAVPSMLYSPYPPSHYTRPCSEIGRVGIGTEMACAGARAPWNLFWLSEPAVDHFLDDQAAWATAEPINLDMLAAAFEACTQRLEGMLVGDLIMSSPAPEFVRVVKWGNHRHLAPYRLRGEEWLRTIDERSKLYRGVVGHTGTVAYLNFRQRPPDLKEETRRSGSATIMTLAFRKT